MNRRTAAAFLSCLLDPVHGAGLGAADYRYLDGIRMVADTGIATLLLVIDRPLEDGLTKPRERSKIQAYHAWVFIQQKLVQAFPAARPDKGVRLVLPHPRPQNALGVSVLEQLVGFGKELRFEVSTQLLSEKKPIG